MNTAVDTNILIDVFLSDPKHGMASKKLLEECCDAGDLIICDVVYSELASCFPTRELFDETLALIQVKFTPMDEESCHVAGMTFRSYRKRGGVKQRVLADFLIAAHALRFADAFATRDRGFYRSYFPKLKILAP